MKKRNSDRKIIKMIREICSEEKIDMNLLSKGWLIMLSRESKQRHIFGYNFDINPSASQKIAQDKFATFEALSHHGVPMIHHELFVHPRLLDFIDEPSIWSPLLAFAKKYDFTIVCKPSNGTGGRNVIRVSNQAELELAAHKLTSKGSSFVACPFEDITYEYRTFVLDGEPLLMYAKHIPEVVGDNAHTVTELMNTAFGEEGAQAMQARMDSSDVDLASIPAQGETVRLTWKHNLSRLAAPSILDIASNEAKEIAAIATQAATAIGIRFATVDVVRTENGALKVMEINSGVAGEKFADVTPDGYTLIKEVYRKAVLRMFE